MKIIIDNKKEIELTNKVHYLSLFFFLTMIFTISSFLLNPIFIKSDLFLPISIFFSMILSSIITVIFKTKESNTKVIINQKSKTIQKGKIEIKIGKYFQATYTLYRSRSTDIGEIEFTESPDKERIYLRTTAEDMVKAKDFIENNTNIKIVNHKETLL